MTVRAGDAGAGMAPGSTAVVAADPAEPSGQVEPAAVGIAGTRGRWTGRWSLSLLGLLAVDAAIALFVLVRTRHEWFFVDEWEFLTRRVGPDPQRGLLIPHNEHPSMIPVLVWRELFDHVGIGHYWPYMAVLVGAHLAVVSVVWAVARRSGAGAGACFVVAAVMATAGVGWENIVWAFQIGMVGSLLASWAGALLVDQPRGGRRLSTLLRLVLAWVVLAAGLACSAVSVPLLVLPLLAAAARRGLWAAVAVVSVPAALFLVWYSQWGRDGVSASKGFVPLQLAGYAVNGLVGALDGLTGVVGTAAVALVLVFAGLRSGVLGSRATACATSGLAGAVALFAFISIGRAGLGDAQAQASRYAYLAAALVLPAAAVGLSRLGQGRLGQGRLGQGRLGQGRLGQGRLGQGPTRSSVVQWAAVGVLTVAVCGQGLGLLDEQIRVRVADASRMIPEATAAAALARSGSPLLAGVATDRFSSYLDGAAVIRLERLGAFRHLRRPSPAAIAESRLNFQLRVAPLLTRAQLTADVTAPAPAAITEFASTGTTLDPVAVGVRPQPFAAAPTIVAGKPGTVPDGIAASLGCRTTVPLGDPAVVQLEVGSGTRAALVLIEGTGPVEYSLASAGIPLVTRTITADRDTVEQLSTLTGLGVVRVSSPHTITVCPVR